MRADSSRTDPPCPRLSLLSSSGCATPSKAAGRSRSAGGSPRSPEPCSRPWCPACASANSASCAIPTRAWRCSPRSSASSSTRRCSPRSARCSGFPPTPRSVLPAACIAWRLASTCSAGARRPGRPFDGSPPAEPAAWYPVYRDAPPPMSRRLIERPLSLGVRAIDGLLTCGEASAWAFSLPPAAEHPAGQPGAQCRGGCDGTRPGRRTRSRSPRVHRKRPGEQAAPLGAGGRHLRPTGDGARRPVSSPPASPSISAIRVAASCC